MGKVTEFFRKHKPNTTPPLGEEQDNMGSQHDEVLDLDLGRLDDQLQKFAVVFFPRANFTDNQAQFRNRILQLMDEGNFVVFKNKFFDSPDELNKDFFSCPLSGHEIPVMVTFTILRREQAVLSLAFTSTDYQFLINHADQAIFLTYAPPVTIELKEQTPVLRGHVSSCNI